MAYKAGTIVRKNNSFWGGSMGESKEEIGNLYVIEYSYGEEYGDRACYSILDMETGSSSAWWGEDKLDFVSDGSPSLIDKLKEKNKAIIKQNSDITWIKENWNDIKDKISSTSILTLLDKIEIPSGFRSSGEYFILFFEWKLYYPIFDLIFSGDKNTAIEWVERIFPDDISGKYIDSIKRFYNELYE